MAKAVKGRSPNYPRLSLSEALDKLRPLYKAIHTYPTPKIAIAENLGYSSISRRLLTLMGTFRRYGLLKSLKNGNFKITDTAVSILELPPASDEWKQAFAEAAFTPDLFSELRSEFPERLPNDATLRHNLIKKGFLPRAAEEIIRVFRANLDVVAEQPEGYTAEMEPTTQQPMALRSPTREEMHRLGATRTAADLHALGIPIPEEGKTLRLNISRNVEAHIVFHGDVTQEAIDRLAKLLDIQKDTFPTEAELEGQRANTAAQE